MIAIQIQGTFLDLFPGTSLSITEANALFDKDSAPRAYSFPFKVPTTAKNTKTFKSAHRLDAVNSSYYDDAILFIDRKPYATGVVKKDGSGRNNKGEHYIKIFFQNAEQLLYDNLDRLKLKRQFKTITIGDPPAATKPHLVLQLDDTPNLYVIRIGDTNYEINGGTSKTQVAQDLSALIDADYPGYTFWVPGQEEIRLESAATTANPPSLQAGHGVTVIEEYTQSQVDFLAIREYVKNINELDDDPELVFPTLYHRNFYESNPEFSNILNFFNTNDTEFVNLPALEPSWEFTFAPQLNLFYVLSTIFDKVGYTLIEEGFFADPENRALLLHSDLAIDQVNEEWYSYDPATGDQVAEGNYLFHNGCQRTINYNDLVPDITGNELLQAFLVHFNQEIRFQNNKVYFTSKRDQLRAKIIDWTSKANTVFSTRETHKDGYIIRFDLKDDNYLSSDDQLAAQSSGLEETDIVLPFTPLQMSFTDYRGNIMLLPTLDYKGSSYVTDISDSQLRIVRYKRLQPGSIGSYPLATSGRTDRLGNIICTTSLFLQGDNNHFDTYWLGFLELINAKEITKPINLSFVDIFQLRRWTNARVYIYTEDGAFTGIVKSIKYKADNLGIDTASVTFKKQ